MRDRYEPALKLLCLVLGALLLVQVGRVMLRGNPLKEVNIPGLPVLTVAGDAATAGKSTNSVSVPANGKGNTNSVRDSSTGKGTNIISATGGSNSAAGTMTNKSGTNMVVAEIPSKTNATSAKDSKAQSEIGKTAEKAETNAVPTTKAGSSNVVMAGSTASSTNAVKGTNSSAKSKSPPGGPNMAMMGGGPFGRPGGKMGPDLAPPIQARVDKIVESEILGPVFHPMPMALMGIAGNVAFLRSPSGQTGLVKEGDELGGVKLLRIGTNRVLVEQSGEKKELMIFEGYGGETLKEKEKTNEPANKHP